MVSLNNRAILRRLDARGSTIDSKMSAHVKFARSFDTPRPSDATRPSDAMLTGGRDPRDGVWRDADRADTEDVVLELKRVDALTVAV